MGDGRRRLWVSRWQRGSAIERPVPAVDGATLSQPAPNAESPSRSIAYWPALDGLRALAVLSVMLFRLDAFALGWAGVPLFFVLSGYPIASIQLTQRAQPLGAYLSNFYWARRSRGTGSSATSCAGRTRSTRDGRGPARSSRWHPARRERGEPALRLICRLRFHLVPVT
jgi:hypothetical protein